jgi:hypothetical protein
MPKQVVIVRIEGKKEERKTMKNGPDTFKEGLRKKGIRN